MLKELLQNIYSVVKVLTFGMLMEMSISIINMGIGPLSLGYAYDKVDERN